MAYLDVVIEAFGAKRLMFGSDWPVCNVVGGYEKILAIVKIMLPHFLLSSRNFSGRQRCSIL